MDKVGALLPAGAAFMNTQLFFNPHNAAQPNYWHRDPQYHLSLPQQKAALSGPEVLHFRVPVRDEPGIELIPGTHRRWDCEDELAVRLEQEGRRNCEALESGEVLPLQAGDLLVFSANMLHRGIYGENRLALDILFCEPDPALMQHVEAGCLPPAAILAGLEDGSAFHATRRLLNGGD